MSVSIHIVEDEQPIITLVKYNLEKEGYKVTTAKNGREAIDTAIRIKPALIILDIMINGKPDGITFAQQLNVTGLNIPFLFLTSINSKTIFEKAKYTQPYNYLLKPYNKFELLYVCLEF